MDVDVPTLSFLEEPPVKDFVATLSLPEHREWSKFIADWGTDIEVFKIDMAHRKRELDEVMEAEKSKKTRGRSQALSPSLTRFHKICSPPRRSYSDACSEGLPKIATSR